MNANRLRCWFETYRRRHDPRQKNYRFLAAIAAEIGSKFEQRAYHELIEADESFGQIQREGIAIGYSVNLYDRRDNGDLAICIDLHSELATPWGIMPTYQFCKRPDGSVYYL